MKSIKELLKLQHYIFKWFENQLISDTQAKALLAALKQKQRMQFNWGELFARQSKLFIAMGTALILAGILVFFAANWAALPRLIKVGLALGIMTIPYAAAHWAAHTKQNDFLSKLFLFAGVFCFGITVALLGQIYNSHANSYVLFLIWLIPVIAYCIRVPFEPFFALAAILINMTLYTFFTADGNWLNPSIYISAFILNTGVFIVACYGYRRLHTGRSAQYIGLFCASYNLYLLTFYHVSGQYVLIYNAIYILLSAFVFYYFLIKNLNIPILYIHLCLVLLYTISKHIEVTSYFFSTKVLNISLVFGLLLIYINTILIKKMNRHISKRQQTGGA